MNGSGGGGGSAALLRRRSSKQGLQNLLRLTAQWSVEDEEEAARERRRRERDRQLRSQSEDGLGGPETPPEQQKLLALKPPELEEDEGFSDWSQKPEQRKPRWGGGDGGLDEGEAPPEDSPASEDRTEGSSHRSYEEEEEEEEEPHLSRTQAGLSQLCVDPASGPEEAETTRDVPEEEMGLLEAGDRLPGRLETEVQREEGQGPPLGSRSWSGSPVVTALGCGAFSE
uniref:Lymphocyte specific protein 1 n=1 Tax=Sarcophilus harrisii TaxID=9305 RepID=A0A7N4NR81_SARHA